jgi:hypothetical protein
MTTLYILDRSGSFMVLVTLEKIGTSPIGSTIMKRATVALTSPVTRSRLISHSPLSCLLVGREGFEPTTFAV